jgi:hypothetical protein
LRIRAFFAAAIALVAVSFPMCARAGGVWTVNVRNETMQCAWITVYHRHGFNPTGWEIARAGWAPAKETSTFRVNSWVELKVRAEIKSGNACVNGANIGDTYDERMADRDRDATYNTHIVRNANGRFNLWFLR